MMVTHSGMNAFGERADDQRRRDRGEGHLEAEVDELGDVGVDAERRHLRIGRHAGQECLGQAADEIGAAGEGEAVAIERVDHGDDTDAVEHLHQH
jgi:hypothetical protein